MSKNARIVNAPSTSSSGYYSQNKESLPSTVYKNNVFLGIAGKTMNNNSVIVVGVVPGSPADSAGIRFKDIILAVDTIKVKTFDDIGFALKDKNPGDRVNLLYMRNGMVNSSPAILVPRN